MRDRFVSVILTHRLGRGVSSVLVGIIFLVMVLMMSMTNSFAQCEAMFYSDPFEGICPITIQFHNESTGTNCTYSWDFGDGTTSTEENPSHIYASPGQFEVSLTINCAGCTDTFVGYSPVFVSEAKVPRTEGNSNGNSGTLGEPVSTATGELYFSTVDLFLGGPLPLAFGRYWGSFLEDDEYLDPYGFTALEDSWMHNFEIRLDLNSDLLRVIYYAGKVIEFEENGESWELRNQDPVIYQMVESGSGYKMMDPSRNLIYTFDEDGDLVEIKDRNGNALTLSYTELDFGDYLRQVSDGLGRTLTFTYTNDTYGTLTQVQDQSGRTISFSSPPVDFTDARGNTTDYSYLWDFDLDQRFIASATQPEGNVLYSQTYDDDWRVITQMDGEGNTHTLAYDTPTNGVTTATDPLGNSMVHTHEDKKNLTTCQDQAGETFYLGYDANNRRNSLTDRLGDTTSSTYHEESGKIASYTDAKGNTTSFTYTTQTQGDFTFYDLTKVDYPDGTSANMTYDTKGNMLTFTDRAGKTWSYTYNAMGKVLTSTNPAGGVTTYTYNTDGTLATRKDHFNNTTSFDYDSKKRLSNITRPDVTTRSFTYDDNNNLLTVTNEQGIVTTFTYNKNNNLETITDPLENTVTYVYNGNNMVNTVFDRLNKTSTLTYDELGRLNSISNPANETVNLDYNANAWLTSVTDPGGNTSTRTYDKEGVIASFTDPLSNTWNFTTDKLGRITGVISPMSSTNSFAYDSMGRLTSYTNPLSQTSTYTYDSRGLLTSINLPEDISASYTRNDLGLITRVTDPNGNNWDCDYNPLGFPTTCTDPLLNTTSYAYDSRNRLSGVTFPEGTLDITRDEIGNVTRRLYSDSTDLQYTYDDNGRLLTTNGASLSYDARGDIIGCNGLTITRDDVGRIASITLAAGKTITYNYDTRGLVYQVSDWVGGSTDLTYDDAGRLVSISRPNGVTTTYTYNNEDRLVGIGEENFEALSSITLIRNADGNITTANRDIPLMPDPGSRADTFTYNAANQISSFTYDNMGRLTGDGSSTYSWDLASRLISYTDGGNTTAFTYDGLDMKYSSASGGSTREYIWNYAFGMPSISVVRQGGNDLRYYVHLPVGRLLHSIEASDNSRHFYHFDEMGTTLFLTDDGGTVTDSYGITTYGNVTAITGTTENPFTFLGAYGVMQEGDTDLYYMRARYYDSTTGRFISHDPVRSISPRSVNPYQYASGNPMYNIDPWGLTPAGLKTEAKLYGMTIHEFVRKEMEKREEILARKRMKITEDYGPALMAWSLSTFGMGGVAIVNTIDREIEDLEKEEEKEIKGYFWALWKEEKELELVKSSREANRKKPLNQQIVYEYPQIIISIQGIPSVECLYSADLSMPATCVPFASLFDDPGKRDRQSTLIVTWPTATGNEQNEIQGYVNILNNSRGYSTGVMFVYPTP